MRCVVYSGAGSRDTSPLCNSADGSVLRCCFRGYAACSANRLRLPLPQANRKAPRRPLAQDDNTRKPRPAAVGKLGPTPASSPLWRPPCCHPTIASGRRRLPAAPFRSSQPFIPAAPDHVKTRRARATETSASSPPLAPGLFFPRPILALRHTAAGCPDVNSTTPLPRCRCHLSSSNLACHPTSGKPPAQKKSKKKKTFARKGKRLFRFG